MKSYFIGFDLGSHSSKGALVGLDGIPVISRSLEHDTLIPVHGWQEQNPETWWDEFQQIAKELIVESGIDPSQIRAVGITGFVPGLVMLGKDDEVLRPAIMHTDLRATLQLKNINKILDSEITHGFLMPKLLWVRDNEADIFLQTSKILVPHGYIVNKLTEKYSCDRDTATIFGGVYDEKSGNWSEEACNRLGIKIDILPELHYADSVVGNTGHEVADLTGLVEGTPVIAGTGDTFAALLGCGAVLPGDMMVYLGTSGTQLYIDGDLDSFTNGPHFGPGKAEFTGRIISSGDSLQHYRDILGFSDWEALDREALDINPGSDGLFIFPHLKQKTDTDTFTGDRETVFGLDTIHNSWHIYRAVLEGIASNLKASFSKYESKVSRLILSGGGARSRVFREILSAMLDMDVHYNSSGDGTIGVALLAAHAVDGTSLKEISSLISSRAEIIEPNTVTVNLYKSHYRKYLKLRSAIEELYKYL
ncbi:MAG: hypothetical protein DRP60_15285 [Spirochaetes bacterium]|nr:MAG: hypothetical protein DRP60_15285 [Spirochaetota bacterium]